MAVETLIPPVMEPVDMDAARQWLRITDNAEDAVIATLLAAARQVVEAQTGLALITRTVRETSPRRLPDGTMELALSPALSVLALDCVQPDGTLLPLDLDAIWLDQVRSRIGWASPYPSRPNTCLAVEYTAGFGETPDDVPAIFRTAILLCVGAWFETRMVPATMPDPARELIAPFVRRTL